MAPTPPNKAQSVGVPSNGNDKTPSQEPQAAPVPSSSSVGDHLAQALRDLARGEQTASALEANLSNLESKLDEILASFGVTAAELDALEEEEKQGRKTGGADGDGVGDGKGAAAGESKEGDA